MKMEELERLKEVDEEWKKLKKENLEIIKHKIWQLKIIETYYNDNLDFY